MESRRGARSCFHGRSDCYGARSTGGSKALDDQMDARKRATRLRFLPGVNDAVNHGNCRNHGDHPQRGRHAVKRASQYEKDKPLRPFHETDFASRNQRLRPPVPRNPPWKAEIKAPAGAREKLPIPDPAVATAARIT